MKGNANGDLMMNNHKENQTNLDIMEGVIVLKQASRLRQ